MTVPFINENKALAITNSSPLMLIERELLMPYCIQCILSNVSALLELLVMFMFNTPHLLY